MSDSVRFPLWSNSGTTRFADLYQNTLGQGPSSTSFHYGSGNNNEVGRVEAVSHQCLRVFSCDCKQNLNVISGATYVACAGDKNFPHVIRVYDADNFAASNFISHLNPPSLKTRFGRACRAFVNAWRAEKPITPERSI